VSSRIFDYGILFGLLAFGAYENQQAISEIIEPVGCAAGLPRWTTRSPERTGSAPKRSRNFSTVCRCCA